MSITQRSGAGCSITALSWLHDCRRAGQPIGRGTTGTEPQPHAGALVARGIDRDR
jgi:hypothetical protein